MINDWTLTVATVNGSGSQSANNILVRSLFRMGLSVAGKNLFPSNIQGLPTWFSIRVSPDGYVGRQEKANIFVGMNLASINEDQKKLTENGQFLYNSDFESKFEKNDRVNLLGIPFRDLVKDASSSVKMRKLLINICYVGILCELLGMDENIVEQTIRDQFESKPNATQPNLISFRKGLDYAKDNNLAKDFPYKVKANPGANDQKVLMDGNTASALGLLYGGCSFLAWYPITPSSSLAENLISYTSKLRKNGQGKLNFANVQAEDELSAINMVLGAGWAGARAVTATSGPGLSLMSEAAGLSYFAEIPAVIWDVQRAGPSTGLPTRTMQADVLAAKTLSHGDTEHILLFPSNPKECFEFGQVSLDLAEELQTLVIVLSDLDLGMNLWISDELKLNNEKFKRGKVLTAKDLNELDEFKRYEDKDGDGIPYRTLPGTQHTKAAYFTRGTGHAEDAGYTESPEVFKKLLDRLKKKTETAKSLVPGPEIDFNQNADVALVAYGSTDFVIPEVRELLKQKGIESSYMRIKAWPLSNECQDFIQKHKRTYIIEQNRDGQLRSMIGGDLRGVQTYDGFPPCPESVVKSILDQEANL